MNVIWNALLKIYMLEYSARRYMADIVQQRRTYQHNSVFCKIMKK